MNRYKEVKNFVFDFGEVLYDVNNDFIKESFYKILLKYKLPLDIDFTALLETAHLFEAGMIAEDDLKSFFNRVLGIEISSEEFDAIWNLALIRKREGVEEIVAEFAKMGRICLLSNTNPIHYRHFEPECVDLLKLFDKVYLSFELKMRKPNPDIFKYVLNDNGFLPEETLFIDDLTDNLIGASKEGIQTYQATKIEDLKVLINTLRSVD